MALVTLARFVKLKLEVQRTASPAAAWHAAWALGVGLGAALLLISLGGAPGSAIAALAFGAAPGAAGWLLKPHSGHGAALLVVWSAACAFAMALTGGVSGPLAVWAAGPIVASMALGGLWRDGATLSFAALTGVALIQAAGKAGPAPTGALALWLGVIGLASLLAGAAGALMLMGAAKPQPTAAAEADPLAEAQARLAQAESARAAAEADAGAKMRFLANMSHELRTPLNAIMGFSDIMRARLFGDLPARYAEYAELIHESGRHLLDLINDVLDMSKIEADKYELRLDIFDVREPVSDALRILRVQADDAHVQLRGLLPGQDLEVEADQRALKQMVLNLASNALKFTPAGGSVTVTVQAAAGELELVVADTGVGIAPEDLERLGRPFEQVGDTERRAGGTGLGLSLVKAFAHLHGGTMTVESRLGEGAAFTVRLPVLVVAGQKARDAALS